MTILSSDKDLMQLVSEGIAMLDPMRNRPIGPAQVATEIAWFNEHDMPWPELAFRTVEPQVHQMYEWLQTGRFGIRVGFADEGSSHYKSYLLAE